MSAAVRPQPLLSGRRGSCAPNAGGGEKVQHAAQLLVYSQAKCEAAHSTFREVPRVPLRKRPLLPARRGAARSGSKGQRVLRTWAVRI